MSLFKIVGVILFVSMVGASILAAIKVFRITNEEPTKTKSEQHFKNTINTGDTVWYQGSKWKVVLHDYEYVSSSTDIHKFLLTNGYKSIAGVDLWEIKKVVRVSNNNHAN